MTKQIKIDIEIFNKVKELKKAKKIKTIGKFANAALIEKLQFFDNLNCKYL